MAWGGPRRHGGCHEFPWPRAGRGPGAQALRKDGAVSCGAQLGGLGEWETGTCGWRLVGWWLLGWLVVVGSWCYLFLLLFVLVRLSRLHAG